MSVVCKYQRLNSSHLRNPLCSGTLGNKRKERFLNGTVSGKGQINHVKNITKDSKISYCFFWYYLNVKNGPELSYFLKKKKKNRRLEAKRAKATQATSRLSQGNTVLVNYSKFPGSICLTRIIYILPKVLLRNTNPHRTFILHNETKANVTWSDKCWVQSLYPVCGHDDFHVSP